MMEIKTRDTSAPVTLADACFDVPYHQALVHQAVVTHAQCGRANGASQKTRAEVRGGGAKPWAQKGTGRARAGSIRSPIWRGGGAAHPAGRQNFKIKINKKMYRHAMRSIVSELLRLERLHVVESFSVSEPKTKLAQAELARLDLPNVLILVDELERSTVLAMRNLPHCELQEAGRVNPVALLRCDHVVLTRAALVVLEKRLGAES